MAYSKLTGIELINFMCYEHETLYFDETGILNLKGYNDSGKSTIFRALAVMFNDGYKRIQTNFIRHDEDYFRIIVYFDDGVSVIRDKYLNGQSLYEMYKGSKLLFTTKEGRKLGKVTCVPEPIKKYFGMCESSTGIINYQSRTTKLLLTDTTGSENYQDLHTVLKSVEISRASQLINADKNKLSQEMVRMGAELQSLELQLAACEKISEDLVLKLSERELIARKNEDMLSDIKGIKSTADTYTSLVPPPRINPIDSGNMRAISDILNTLNDIENLTVLPRIEKVDIAKYKRASSLVSIAEEYARYTNSVLPVVNTINTEQVELLSTLEEILADYEKCCSMELPIIPKVDTSNMGTIESILKTCNGYEKVLNRYEEVSTELEDVRKELGVLTKEAKEQGYSFASCPNCGTFVEVRL